MTANLRVDWPACQRRGLCAEVLPEVLSLDEWGFPVVGAAVPPELIGLAQEAAAVCPHSALRLIREA